jgi:hypothetical protein
MNTVNVVNVWTRRTLQSGAVLLYTPEVGIDLNILSKDVKRLKTRFQLDVKGKSQGRIVLRYCDFFVFENLNA